MKQAELLALTAAPIYAALIGAMRPAQRETYDDALRKEALLMALQLIDGARAVSA